jgi:hypothetical protein
MRAQITPADATGFRRIGTITCALLVSFTGGLWSEANAGPPEGMPEPAAQTANTSGTAAEGLMRDGTGGSVDRGERRDLFRTQVSFPRCAETVESSRRPCVGRRGDSL